MNLLQSIWRAAKLSAAVAACWLAMFGTVLAKEAKKEEGGASWIPSYGLVMLGIVLGMLGVCLTSRRREREKPETYAKSQLLPGQKE